MWKSSGVWVESKYAAWSEFDGEVEVVAEVAPRAGDRTTAGSELRGEPHVRIQLSTSAIKRSR